MPDPPVCGRACPAGGGVCVSRTSRFWCAVCVADGEGHGRAPQAWVAASTRMVAVDRPGGREAGQYGTGHERKVEHILREELRKRELLRVEAKRPRLFAGMGGEIIRGLTLAYLSHCDTELDKALLRGALAGALWTAVRAHERGL